MAGYSSLVSDDSPHITPSLSYPDLDALDGEVPWIRQYTLPTDDIKLGLPTNVKPRPVDTPVYDLRAVPDVAAVTSIETTGFQVVSKDLSGTSMRYEDWSEESRITGQYYEEVKHMLKKITGATRVEIFDHTVRRGERPTEITADTPENRKPVTKVHVDQTPQSGRKRVIRHTGEDAERLLRGKAQLINVWRPLRGPVKDMPLAFADARTLKKEDLVPSRLIYKDQPEGETFQVKYSPDHRWYYLSDMQPDEALLLLCWENKPEVGNITPHTAFVDDRYYGKEGIELRQSIEIRALVFYEDEGEK